MNRELRPKPGTVVRNEPSHKTVVVRVVETERKLTVHTHTTYDPKAKWGSYGKPKDSDGTITHTKCLCVNGPLVGQYKVPDDVVNADYSVYNRSFGRYRHASPPKTVLVYTKDILI